MIINIFFILIICYVTLALSIPELENPNTSPALPIHQQNKSDCKNQYDFDKLNSLYLTNFEQKIIQIINTINGIDSNIKSLQEKAHVWELYRHHITAWDDHMKSLDHKIDLIKYTQDDTKSIESKLTSLEFSINHILSKIVQMDGNTVKTNRENYENFEYDFKEIFKNLKNQKSNDNKEILNRLNNILRHVLNIENDNCRISSRSSGSDGNGGGKNLRIGPKLMQPIDKDNNNNSILKGIDNKLDEFFKNVSPKDLKQFASAARKTTKSLEDILEVINNVDERTIRLFDAEAQHSNKYLNVCQATTNELSTFTESSDLLLKRIENLVLNIKEKVELISTNNTNNKTEIHDEKLKKRDSIPENKTNIVSTTTETINYITEIPILNSDETQEEESTESIEPDFVQPRKTGCHDLTVRIDGVYKFGEITDRNDANRDFNERYCSFPTNGAGWTIIQRRGPYDYQENFNRSWTDYRDGFGSLAKDFWFGNEFVHRIVYKDSYELRIELEDFDNVRVWTEYSIFQIDSEKYNYNLLIGGYRGAVPDSMLYHHNQDFSTYDRRNDKSIDVCCPCATGYGSGWWFDNCSEANLNGIYHETPLGHNYIGIVWEHWHGDYSLKKARMLIRPKNYNDGDDVETEFPDDP